MIFRLREAPPERLDLSPLVPRNLAGLSAGEIERLGVGTTRLGLVVGDVFDVSHGDPEDIRIAGGSARLDRVGEKLAAGRIVVEGDVGQRLAFCMGGGEIRVVGSAGPYAASAATGGIVHVEGDAQDCAGGAVHGAMFGLCGATLVIDGQAGARLGDRMKSGLILVRAAGHHAGCRMIAGTIVAGKVGDDAGYAMRRGTLVVREHGRLPPTFVDTGHHRLVFLRLLQRMPVIRMQQWAEFVPESVARYAGDLATLGKGEILVPAN